MGGVNLIVSCTKRKTREPRPSLRLRDLDSTASIRKRAEEWVRRLSTEPSDRIAANVLYAGDHWKIVRSIADELFGRQRVRVWVCSAGYGLITPDSLLAPYDATFTPGQPDSVLRSGRQAKELLPLWWEALGAWKGPPSAPCRSLAAVAESHPDDFLLVALSGDYLKAVAAELAKAAAILTHPDRLAIICVGTDSVPSLDAHLLPCDARLQSVAGGVLSSLNVRLAFRLLGSIRKDLSLSRCKATFRRWMRGKPEWAVPSRTPTTDEEVRQFIHEALTGNSKLRPTPLLQTFRRGGRACEHSRFIHLFHEVQSLNHATI